jgi:hypothetical protein
MMGIYDEFQATNATADTYRFSQNYNNWAVKTGQSVNKVAYAQNVMYSMSSGKSSYTAPSSSGTNSNFSSQTYQVPSGGIVDLDGDVVVPSTQKANSRTCVGLILYA